MLEASATQRRIENELLFQLYGMIRAKDVHVKHAQPEYNAASALRDVFTSREL